MLKYVPRIGVPRDPNPWLNSGGVITALVHAPWLMFSDFLCVRFCTPSSIRQTVTVLGGYLDVVVLVFVLVAIVRAWQMSIPAR